MQQDFDGNFSGDGGNNGGAANIFFMNMNVNGVPKRAWNGLKDASAFSFDETRKLEERNAQLHITNEQQKTENDKLKTEKRDQDKNTSQNFVWPCNLKRMRFSDIKSGLPKMQKLEDSSKQNDKGDEWAEI